MVRVLSQAAEPSSTPDALPSTRKNPRVLSQHFRGFVRRATPLWGRRNGSQTIRPTSRQPRYVRNAKKASSPAAAGRGHRNAKKPALRPPRAPEHHRQPVQHAAPRGAGKPPTYSFVEVPDAASGRRRRPAVEVPATRQRWLGMKDELKGLCDEAVRRRAEIAQRRKAADRLASAAPLYEAYAWDGSISTTP